MVAFQEKRLDDRTIGDALRTAREARGETPADVERATRVDKKFIVAFEANDFKALPEPVYAKKFAKALAAHYGLDPVAAVENLQREMAVVAGLRHTNRPANFIEGRGLLVAPALLKTGLIAAAFLAIIGYFTFSVHRILRPPSVTLYSPHDAQVFPTSRVVLEGVTEPEVDLQINGESVPIEQDGAFKDVLNLPPGVSNLHLTARKKHSRTNDIFLKVVVNAPQEAASATPETSATGT